MERARCYLRHWPDLAMIVALIGAIVWFCSALVFHGEVPFFRDLPTYFYPLLLSVAQSFKAGQLPLWDHRFAQGFPLLAAFQPAVFYPPHVLLGLAPFFVAIRLLFVMHFIIAILGTYRLFVSWRCCHASAAIGALTFSLGGTLVSLTNLLNHFQSAVWLPWVLLSWERLLTNPNPRKFCTFAIICTFQFLAGSPEFFVLSMILVVLDATRFIFKSRRLAVGSIVGLLAGAILLMSLLSMAQILPTAELFLESRRQYSIPTSESVSWSLHPSHLLNIFFVDREIEITSSSGIRYLFRSSAPFFITYYTGCLSFITIILYLYRSPRREKITICALIVGFLVLALGSWTPIYPYLLRHVPGIGMFRFPEKFYFVCYALLLFAFVRGVDHIFDDHIAHRKTTLILLVCCCVFWLALYLLALYGSQWLAYTATSVTDVADIPQVLLNIERQLLLTLAIVVAICLTMLQKLKPALLKILLVGVVFVDLLSANKGFLFTFDPKIVVAGPGEVVQRPSVGQRTLYYPSETNLHPSSVVIKGRPTYAEFIALWFRNLLPNAGVFYGAEYLQDIDALGRRPYSAFLTAVNRMEPEAQIRLLRAFNVEHVIAFRSLAISGLSLVGKFPDAYSWIYRIDKPVPRAYIVSNSTTEKDVIRTLHRLADETFDPLSEVVLDRPLETAEFVKGTGDARSEIVRYENTFVRVKTVTSGGGILVLLDAYYPGWKAYVDGKETSIARANHFYRAVVVPPGQHVVDFRYEPLSFRIGLYVSALTLLCILVVTSISCQNFYASVNALARLWDDWAPMRFRLNGQRRKNVS